MRTIYVSPEFPLNCRMRKDVRRGKLQVIREGGERSSLGGGIPSGKGPEAQTVDSTWSPKVSPAPDLMPEVLYKYAPPCKERIAQVILENQIYFSNPRAFNDPFDCRVAPDISTQEKEEKWVNRCFADMDGSRVDEIRQLQQSNPDVFRMVLVGSIHNLVLRANTGVCCFSKKGDSVPMWAHYAGSHEGVCFKISPFRGNEFVTTLGVGVSKDPRTFPFMMMGDMSYDPKYLSLAPVEKLEDLQLLFRKSIHWKHEEEWRAVMPNKPKSVCTGPGPYSLGLNRLSGVILGYRMNSELKDAVVKMARTKNVPILQAWPKFSSYGMEISPYDESVSLIGTWLTTEHRL